MASTTRGDNLQTFGFKRFAVRGRFLTNGALDPPAASNKGKRWSVTHTGTGVYSIVFNDKFVDFEDIHVSMTLSAVWGSAVIGSWTPSTRTLQIRTYAEVGGVIQAADFAFDGTNGVNFMVVFKNTTL